MNRAATEEIFRAAVARVDPVAMVEECVSLDGDMLVVTAGDRRRSVDLSAFREIWVVGAGKASARMALGLERVLGERIARGLVAVKYGHTEELNRVELVEAGHPIPDEQSVAAAHAIAEIADAADQETLVIILVSGGGSALLTSPYRDTRFTLSLDDIQTTTRLLLECGAPIQQINTVRKHLSAIAGGRLCARLYPATVLTLILSDVVGDSLENIASGLTTPDPATFSNALEIVERFAIADRLPAVVRALLNAGVAGEVPDTPGPDDVSFARVDNILVGTNALAIEAARTAAERLGFNTVALSSQITGEAAEVAKFYAGIAREVVRGPMLAGTPACILGGGETTVTIRGDGLGGRNQELALAFVREIEGDAEAFRGVTFLSGATDGNDGPTDAAGAFAAAEVVARAIAVGASADDALARNDSYTFFGATGDLLKTGPTNTNVCDIHVLLVE